MASTSDQVAAAARLAGRGRFREARGLLEELAAREPRHADVLNGLGALALMEGDAIRALEALGAGATLHPRHAGLVANLAAAYRQLDRNEDALACIETAIALEPGTIPHHLVLSELRLAANDPEGALAALEVALTLAPRRAETHLAIGVVLAALRSPEAAERALRNAIELDPELKTAHHNLAELLSNSGRLADALRHAERAYLLDPTERGFGLGYVRRLFALGRLDEAERVVKRLHAAAPQDPDATVLRAQIEIANGNLQAGLARAAEPVRRNPADAATLSTFARTLRMAGKLDEALVAVDSALARMPAPALRGQREDLLRALGRFEESWAPQPDIALPARVSTVFVLAEADIGEAVLLSRLRARVDPAACLVVAEEIAPIFAAAGWTLAETGADIVEAQSALIQELPRILGSRRADLAWDGAYLASDPARLAPWVQALSEFPGPRIGVMWSRAAPGATLDLFKAAFADLPAIPVGLAVDEARHGLANWPGAIDGGRQIEGAADLIAALDAVDAVICVDCMAAHLAGGLGKPGLVLAGPQRPWTLFSEDGRSVFYPSLEVFAQARPGSWASALAPMRAFIARMLGC